MNNSVIMINCLPIFPVPAKLRGKEILLITYYFKAKALCIHIQYTYTYVYFIHNYSIYRKFGKIRVMCYTESLMYLRDIHSVKRGQA